MGSYKYIGQVSEENRRYAGVFEKARDEYSTASQNYGSATGGWLVASAEGQRNAAFDFLFKYYTFMESVNTCHDHIPSFERPDFVDNQRLQVKNAEDKIKAAFGTKAIDIIRNRAREKNSLLSYCEGESVDYIYDYRSFRKEIENKKPQISKLEKHLENVPRLNEFMVRCEQLIAGDGKDWPSNYTEQITKIFPDDMLEYPTKGTMTITVKDPGAGYISTFAKIAADTVTDLIEDHSDYRATVSKVSYEPVPNGVLDVELKISKKKED